MKARKMSGEVQHLEEQRNKNGRVNLFLKQKFTKENTSVDKWHVAYRIKCSCTSRYALPNNKTLLPFGFTRPLHKQALIVL